MQIVVFAGPTVSAREGGAIVDATWRPPAAQGDVYEAAAAGAHAIAIVDGYFERVPAVWHREILWAMARGVHVFGSASMGALRAAELHTFGMVGVGAIFEAYRDGVLEDDDEVAIVHRDAENGFRPSSEAMVNIRATLVAAVRETIVSQATADVIVGQAKALFYPNRHYGTILRLALESGAIAEDIDRLAAWLPSGVVDQKRLDAEAMLRQLADFSSGSPGPKVVRYRFQHTDAWEQVRRQIERRPLDTVPGVSTPRGDAVLDELRIRREMYGDVWRSVLIRCLAMRVSRADGDRVGSPQISKAIESFRREHGLRHEADVDRWVAEQGWTRDALLRAIDDRALADRVITIQEADLDRHLSDELRLRGAYATLAARARDKHEVLTARGLESPTCADLEVSEAELWRWFFDLLGIPAASTPQDAATLLGLSSLDALRRLALREFAFLRLREDA